MKDTEVNAQLMRGRRPKRSTAGEEGPASARLTPEQIRERTFQRAIKLLAAKSRSVAELRESLLQGHGSNEAMVEAVIG